jgi:hypothetical protein
MPGLRKSGASIGIKVMNLILLVTGILIMIFIVVQGCNIFQESKQGSDRQVSGSQCFGYIYSVREIAITPDLLKFRFINDITSTEDVHNITVMDSSGEKHSVVLFIPMGSDSEVAFPLNSGANFSIYPDNCQVFAEKCTAGGCSLK